MQQIIVTLLTWFNTRLYLASLGGDVTLALCSALSDTLSSGVLCCPSVMGSTWGNSCIPVYMFWAQYCTTKSTQTLTNLHNRTYVMDKIETPIYTAFKLGHQGVCDAACCAICAFSTLWYVISVVYSTTPTLFTPRRFWTVSVILFMLSRQTRYNRYINNFFVNCWTLILRLLQNW